MWVLLAQDGKAPIDVISGGGGWVGAGLLGLVLSWLLLKHLPAKDAQLKERDEAKDRLVQTITDRYEQLVRSITEKYEVKLDAVTAAFRAESREAREEFKGALSVILAHCEKETGKMIETFRNEIQRVARNDAP